MCGIAGFWSIDTLAAHSLAETARRMASAIAHRGPDDAGAWACPSSGLALGHRRLAILDLSQAGHQPMHSADGRHVIVFNGEIYNHEALRRALEQDGAAPPWKGHSDTETLLACVTAWGLRNTLERSTGMFAFALWDRAERTLSLARDRIGEKPLYYGRQGNAFLFGSELRALRAHDAFQGRLDRTAVALLLRRNYIPAPYSVYEGIRKLAPGTFLTLRIPDQEATPVPYWSLRQVAAQGAASPFRGTDTEALSMLESKLGAAVRTQMVADVPVGALLSGGIDSSLVVALARQHATKGLRTFTIGFNNHEYDEARHARAVAEFLGTQHTELRVTDEDALKIVSEMPSVYDEPFADSSQVPTYLVMKLARQHVTVALSGDAGDELFGGYNRYVRVPQIWRRFGWMRPGARRLVGRMLTALPTGTIDATVRPIAHRLGVAQPGDKAHKLGRRLSGMRGMQDLYASLINEWSDGERAVPVLGATPATGLLDEQGAWAPQADPVAAMMLGDSLGYLPDDILAKVDRAAMAVSLETRVPFLDRDVIEFAWTLPGSVKIRDGETKWLLRNLLSRHLPRTYFDRPKMGFGIPLDDWLRGPLRDWAEELLSEARLRREGFLDPMVVRATWGDHLAGRANGNRLWSVLMFEAWLEVNA